MKFLDDILMQETGSTPAAPANNNFGTLFASASEIHYRNANELMPIGRPSGSINILYYTGSARGNGATQTYTWSKIGPVKYVQVCAVGAGGGGGSGRKATSSNISQGGNGGGGGSIVWATFDAVMLPSNVTITVGAGGAGGLGQTVNGAGNAGTAGNSSSFGTLVIAEGGRGGNGGTVAAAIQTQGGRAINCTPAGAPYAVYGCPGQYQAATPSNTLTTTAEIFNLGQTSTALLFYGNGGGGGGNGGGRATAFLNGTLAGSGSSGRQFNTLITNSGYPGVSASAAGVNGGNATDPSDNLITTLLQFTASTTLYGLGGGGHGGGASVLGNGGAGSIGGLYGAGGGGGGCAANSNPASASGIGGSGSAGLVIVTEFY